MRHGILIVENELIVATDLHARLTFLGYPVVGTTVSGEQALRAIELQPPDLVLMDIRLSGPMDGIEAAETVGTR